MKKEKSSGMFDFVLEMEQKVLNHCVFFQGSVARTLTSRGRPMWVPSYTARAGVFLRQFSQMP